MRYDDDEDDDENDDDNDYDDDDDDDDDDESQTSPSARSPSCFARSGYGFHTTNHKMMLMKINHKN